ncbi:unnamed protein product [Paramecium sonneborni]|uniref:Uncharacterized protein n=1 Tax=Paramecium sonneborni TaxID=65129 RepID=A0A8S1RT91_9CILI|nr:unnamed protein product [Paramecium sonneborni]
MNEGMRNKDLLGSDNSSKSPDRRCRYSDNDQFVNLRDFVQNIKRSIRRILNEDKWIKMCLYIKWHQLINQNFYKSFIEDNNVIIEMNFVLIFLFNTQTFQIYKQQSYN